MLWLDISVGRLRLCLKRPRRSKMPRQERMLSPQRYQWTWPNGFITLVKYWERDKRLRMQCQDSQSRVDSFVGNRNKIMWLRLGGSGALTKRSQSTMRVRQLWSKSLSLSSMLVVNGGGGQRLLILCIQNVGRSSGESIRLLRF